MNITITTSDGKVFKGTDYNLLAAEVNAYEANLKLKKEEEERKEKELSKLKEDGLKEIREHVKVLNNMVKEYEKSTDVTLDFFTLNGDLVVSENIGALAYRKIFDSIYRQI